MSYEIQEVFFNPNKESVAVSVNTIDDIHYYVYDYLTDSGFFARYDLDIEPDHLSDEIKELSKSFYLYADHNGMYGFYYHYKKADVDKKIDKHFSL